MSSELKVYVGPYFKTNDRLLLASREHDHVVIEGRGDLYGEDGDGVMYLIPNCFLPGVTRQMQFSRDAPMPVESISPDDVDNEIAEFDEIAEKFLNHAASLGVAVDRCWGVVCDLS